MSSLTGLMGRWQYAGHRPDIVLDTGHNTGGWAYLGKALQSGNYPQVHVIFGIMADKDVDGVLSFLPQNCTTTSQGLLWQGPCRQKRYVTEPKNLA